MRFDEALKARRQEMGLTPEEIAKMLGVHRTSYQVWERFSNVPSKPTVKKIKSVMGIDISESANIERAKRSKRKIIVSETNVIAQLIANERIRRGMSITEACKTYKVAVDVWRRWEQNDSMNYSDRSLEIISKFTGKSDMELWRMQNTRRWKNHPDKWREVLEALDNKDYKRAAEIGRKYF